MRLSQAVVFSEETEKVGTRTRRARARQGDSAGGGGTGKGVVRSVAFRMRSSLVQEAVFDLPSGDRL